MLDFYLNLQMHPQLQVVVSDASDISDISDEYDERLVQSSPPMITRSVINLTILWIVAQFGDFYYYTVISSSSSEFPNVTIATNISVSFWFLGNAILGIQSSLYFLVYYLIRHYDIYQNEQYRNPFVFSGTLLLLLGIYWTVLGYIAFFTVKVPLYIILKLALQTIVYVFTSGVWCRG